MQCLLMEDDFPFKFDMTLAAVDYQLENPLSYQTIISRWQYDSYTTAAATSGLGNIAPVAMPRPLPAQCLGASLAWPG
jgi:hypothetical protein